MERVVLIRAEQCSALRGLKLTAAGIPIRAIMVKPGNYLTRFATRNELNIP
jgi:hypothetical protein